MANKNFSKVQGLDKEVKMLFAQVSWGSSGTPTLRVKGLGVTSVARDTTGIFTFTLDAPYTRLLGVQVCDAHDNAPLNQQWMLKEDTFVSLSHFQMHCVVGSTGSAGDPHDGSVSLFTILVKNSTVGE